MRYPAAETAEKHRKILEQASRLFKERGFDGVSVSEIMKATGLTHGPFYNHFESKEALMAECIAHSGEAALAYLDETGKTPEGMRAYVRSYLSPEHRDSRADGCLVAAFAAHAGHLAASTVVPPAARRAPFCTAWPVLRILGWLVIANGDVPERPNGLHC